MVQIKINSNMEKTRDAEMKTKDIKPKDIVMWGNCKCHVISVGKGWVRIVPVSKAHTFIDRVNHSFSVRAKDLN